MKILHLSDLHIGYLYCEDRFSTVTDNIIAYCTDTSSYLIVITGDVVDKGKRSDQYAVANTYVTKLRNAGFIVLLVPGNHDYGSGIYPQEKFGKKFNEIFYGKSDLDYPILGDPNGQKFIDNIAFIGLDSMEAEVEERDYIWGAEGRFGTDQLTKLDKLLQEDAIKNCKYRVVYFHHHPFKQLMSHGVHDVKELEEIIIKNGNVDILLFGHNHKGLKWNGMWGVKRCYDGGSATRKKEDSGYHRIIDLDLDVVFDIDGDFHGSAVV